MTFFCQSLGLIGLHASKLLIKDKLICSKITPPQYYAATQDNSPSQWLAARQFETIYNSFIFLFPFCFIIKSNIDIGPRGALA
jgi:hypothetical protein